MDYLHSENFKHKILVCPTLEKEIESNLGKRSTALVNYRTFTRRRLIAMNKFEYGIEATTLKKGCRVSDPDDEHLIKCVNYNNCTLIVTNDHKLQISKACDVVKISVADFLIKVYKMWGKPT